MNLKKATFTIMHLSMTKNNKTSLLRAALIGILCTCLSGCTKPVEEISVERLPSIFPDYTQLKIPKNIAPLNFKVAGRPYEVTATIQTEKDSFQLQGTEQIHFPLKRWKKLLSENAGKKISVQISARWEKQKLNFLPFYWEVSEKTIDPYLVYRLIEPGYTTTNEMSINQRNIENFEEETLIDNTFSETGCINCHSFCTNDPEKMLFHSRQKNPGTYFIQNGKIEKVNTKAGNMIQAAGYPFWHPSGNYVAFSVSQTRQLFHEGKEPIEVFDLTSNVIVYDLKKHTVLTTPFLFDNAKHNNYPVFTPDGKQLIYCSDDTVALPLNKNKLELSLCKISFNPENGTFGSVVDTLISSSETGKSMLHPRVSVDGKQLLYTEMDYGSFSNYSKSADLAILDLSTGEYRTMTEVNSDDVDSYHSWSSTGNWVVFSSRRTDGLYTQPWFTYIDETGKGSKPFLLPQKDPDYYIYQLKSYNVPELVKERVNINPYHLRKSIQNSQEIKSNYQLQPNDKK